MQLSKSNENDSISLQLKKYNASVAATKKTSFFQSNATTFLIWLYGSPYPLSGVSAKYLASKTSSPVAIISDNASNDFLFSKKILVGLCKSTLPSKTKRFL